MRKKNFEPYKIPGRWVRFFIESTGSAYHLTNSDLDGCSISSTYLNLPAGKHAINVMIDPHLDGGTSTTATSYTIGSVRRNGNGTQSISLPGAALFDYAYVYAYII